MAQIGDRDHRGEGTRHLTRLEIFADHHPADGGGHPDVAQLALDQPDLGLQLRLAGIQGAQSGARVLVLRLGRLAAGLEIVILLLRGAALLQQRPDAPALFGEIVEVLPGGAGQPHGIETVEPEFLEGGQGLLLLQKDLFAVDDGDELARLDRIALADQDRGQGAAGPGADQHLGRLQGAGAGDQATVVMAAAADDQQGQDAEYCIE